MFDKIMLIVAYTIMLAVVGYFVAVVYVLSGGLAAGGLILVVALVFWNDAKKGKI